MALPDYVRIANETGVTFKTGGTVSMDLSGLTNGAAQQSAKYTFPDPRAAEYVVFAENGWGSAPTAGGTVDYYWAPSLSSTAGTQNAGGCSGSDAAYTGYSSNLADSLKDLIYIGSLVATAYAGAHKQVIGRFSPPTKYGMMVAVNNTSVTTSTSDTDNMVTIEPVVDSQTDS